MQASGFINITGKLEADRQNIVSQLMNWTMEEILTWAKIDHLPVIRVFSQQLDPLFEVYIWERFIMLEEFFLFLVKRISEILSYKQFSYEGGWVL